MIVDTTDPREQRKFGLVMAGAFAILGAIRWALHRFEELPLILWSIALFFLILGVVLPRALQPVFHYWMKFALAVNYVMTRVFLAVAFYVIITPTRVIIYFFGDDPLKRKWLPQEETYWEAPEDQPKEIERYRQQF